ncbi:hypothetical protein FP2506_09831 [Fulvimarina pelagi HTCC2506]|uniref:Uncharacterized protein n=1 Tax=Fulvimarina pelagi HTCC2506 TaxID=314231 RepID=Q0G5D0_9HYPH|nr:hypothetical protein FP2506_09831 [Fulvimarina pelagi HTCC2506]
MTRVRIGPLERLADKAEREAPAATKGSGFAPTADARARL